MNAQEATQTALFHTASSSYPHAVAPTPFTQSSLNSRSAAASYLPGAMFTSGYYAEGAGVRGNEAAVQPLLMQAPPRASDAEPRSYAGFNPSNASSATNAAAAQYYPPNMLSMMGSASGQPLMGLMPYAHYYQYNQQNHQNGGAQNALSDYYASYNSALGTTSNAAGPAGAETPRAVASDSGAAVSTLASGSHYPNFPISPPGFYPASMNINVSMKMNLIGIQQPNSPMEVCGAATTAPPTSGPPAALYPTGYSGADAICSNSAPSSSGTGSDLLARSYQMLNSWKTPAAAAASPKSNAYCTNESLAYWYSCGGAYPAELGATVRFTCQMRRLCSVFLNDDASCVRMRAGRRAAGRGACVRGGGDRRVPLARQVRAADGTAGKRRLQEEQRLPHLRQVLRAALDAEDPHADALRREAPYGVHAHSHSPLLARLTLSLIH